VYEDYFTYMNTIVIEILMFRILRHSSGLNTRDHGSVSGRDVFLNHVDVRLPITGLRPGYCLRAKCKVLSARSRGPRVSGPARRAWESLP
jgi:hypothetical protein